MKITKAKLRQIVKEELESITEADDSKGLPNYIKKGFIVKVPIKFDLDKMRLFNEDEEGIRKDLEDKFGVSIDDKRKFEKKFAEDVNDFLDFEYFEEFMNF